MPNAHRVTSFLLALLLAAIGNACEGPGATAGGVLGDSTYVAAIADLQRMHDERARAPLPPVPIVPGPNGSAPTAEGQRRRDSVVRQRADSIVTVDSAARTAILAHYKVSVVDLEATARALAGDPAHLLRVNEAIYRRVTALGAAANTAKAEAAKAAAAPAASPAPATP